MYRISNIYVLAGFATIGGLLFGFDISSMSAWIGTEQYTTYFNHPDSDLQGIITASMSLGSFAGSLAAGPLSDKLGRKLALAIACVIWIVGSIVTATTHSVGQLIAGRVINGLCVGITSSQVPVYLSELSRKEIRGRVVGIQQWSIEWGILIMFFISYGCSFIKGTTSFRLAWGLQAIPAAILLAAIPFFPESPRWFAEKGRWDECREILMFLHGETEVSQIEFEEIKLQVEAERSAGNGWLGLFGKDLFMYKRITVGIFTQLWQQMLGGNVMMYYIVYVFQMAGLTGNVNLTSSSIQYVIFLVTTGITLVFIDKIGRRPLFIYGGILMGALNFAVAGTMASYGRPVSSVDGNSNIKWQLEGKPATGVIACTYLFVAVYGFTWAPAAWIYISEIFPSAYRAKGVGVSAATNWIFNFALAYFVPPAFRNITWRTYIIFGVFCFCGVVHSFLMFPETCGLTLEEVDDHFAKGSRAWKTKRGGRRGAGNRAAEDVDIHTDGGKLSVTSKSGIA